MIWIRNGLLAFLVAISGLVGSSALGAGSPYFSWHVFDVPEGDSLNVHSAPSNESDVLVRLSNGRTLKPTGRCTGGLHLDEVSDRPISEQQQAVRGRWCEVRLGPTDDGRWRLGWVSGRFIRPNAATDIIRCIGCKKGRCHFCFITR